MRSGKQTVEKVAPSTDKWLEKGTHFFLFIFVAAAPLSIAVTQIAYGGALLCWLLRWIVCRHSPWSQPLVLPLSLFLFLSTVSAAFSFAPLLSCAQLKSVALLLICILWAQATKSLQQLRVFSVVLFVACIATVAYTAWQYTIGIGVHLSMNSPQTALARLGLQDGDSISSVNGHAIRDPAKLGRAIEQCPPGTQVQMTLLRGQPLQKLRVTIDLSQLAALQKEVEMGNVRLSRGHPIRAQGFYDHYVTYADVLVQIALLVWGLFAACPPQRMPIKILLGSVVLIMAGALWLTLTRAAMASFLAGCLLVIFVACRWKVRIATVGLLLVAIVIGGFLLRERRGLTWMDVQSPEAQYRLMMWKDGLRLIREHPFWGVGMESIKSYWSEWNIGAYRAFPLRSHFHSTPIQIAVERGLLTLFAWLYLLAEYTRILVRLLKLTKRADWYTRGLALGLLSSACGFLLGSLVDYSWGDSEVIMIFWMCMGWTLALEHSLSTPSESSEAHAGQ
jgi:hypothetical protein